MAGSESSAPRYPNAEEYPAGSGEVKMRNSIKKQKTKGKSAKAM